MLPRERLRRSGVMGDLYIHTRLGRFSFANVARMCAAVAASRVAAHTRPAHETGPATAAPGRQYRRVFGCDLTFIR